MMIRCDAGDCRPPRGAPVAHHPRMFVTKRSDLELERRADAAGPSGERLADLQRRVRDGSYDNRGVMEQVARRILQRGDL